MRSISYITPTFWTRGSGKKLRGNSDAIALAFYLMSAPQSSYLGLYYSSLAQIANDLGWTVDKVKSTFPAVAEIARYDDDAELVWVPATLKHQIGDEMGAGDKRRANIERELKLIGDHEFVSEFLDMYAESHGLSLQGNGRGRVTKAPPVGTKSKEGREGQEGASGVSQEPRKGHPADRAGAGSPSTNPPSPPIPNPTHSNLEGAGNLSGGEKIKPGEFQPGPEHQIRAQELNLTEKNIQSALSAYRQKAKKSRTYTEHSQSFLNFLQSEVSSPNEDQENKGPDPDAPGKPPALFWYEHHLGRGEAEEAEKYRLKCVKLGLLKGKN